MGVAGARRPGQCLGPGDGAVAPVSSRSGTSDAWIGLGVRTWPVVLRRVAKGANRRRRIGSNRQRQRSRREAMERSSWQSVFLGERAGGPNRSGRHTSAITQELLKRTRAPLRATPPATAAVRTKNEAATPHCFAPIAVTRSSYRSSHGETGLCTASPATGRGRRLRNLRAAA